MSELAAEILSGLEKAGRGIEIRDLLVGATALQDLVKSQENSATPKSVNDR